MKTVLQRGDRVVLATFGTHGDIFPFLAIARQLKRRGVCPVIATSPFYRQLVKDQGLEFWALPPSEDQLFNDLRLGVPAAMGKALHKLGGAKFAATRVVLPYLEQTYQQLEAACAGAKMLISHSYVFAAPLVAQRLNIAWRSVCLQPLAFLSPYDPAVLSELLPIHRLHARLGPDRYEYLLDRVKGYTRSWFAPVDRLRQKVGLPASSKHPLFEGSFSPGGTFAMFDPVLQGDRRGLPDNVDFVGFSHWDGSVGKLPVDVRDFLKKGTPPVVFTLGTSAVHNPGRFYEMASASAEKLNVRAVFLHGDRKFKTQAPWSQVGAAWASHSALFPRALAVVHQGGMGTCFQAMRAGVPQLIVPHGNDQPDNAARLERRGVALSMKSWSTSEKKMLDKLEQLLQEPSFAQNAQALSRRLLPRDGAETVASILTSD